MSLIEGAAQKDEKTGLYPVDMEEVASEGGMKEFTLSLSTAKEMPWESKHNPQLFIRCVSFVFLALTHILIS